MIEKLSHEMGVLEERCALYSGLYNHAPVPMGITDEDGRLIEYNEAFIHTLGHTRQDLAQIKDTSELYENPQDHFRILELIKKNGRVYRFESKMKRKNGTTCEVLVSGALIEIHGRRLIHGVVEDISDRKELEERLRHAQKMEAVGQLAGGIAHDFNNLLTAILGNTSMLLPMQTGIELELLRGIESGALRAADLVRKLLGFSKRSMLSLQPVDLRVVVDDTIRILSRAMDPRIQVEIETSNEVWKVKADFSQMSQVLMNLCLNSRDAMQNGGVLRIETKSMVVSEAHARQIPEARVGDFVRLRVKDSGHGIPEEIRDKVFDPFFTTKTESGGTGLGLAMVFGIVQQHKGWLECTSEVGKGTTIDVYLPRLSEAMDEVAPVHFPSDGAYFGQETVLVVDDEILIRDLAKKMLDRFGYKAMVAASGEEALKIFREKHKFIDLVLLDVLMPRLSGPETLQQLRELDPNVPVILSSGYSADQFDGGTSIEAAGLIQKPYRAEDLARAIRRALDHKKIRPKTREEQRPPS